MAEKWYENPAVDESEIISSRIRLARNLAAYPFPSKISDGDAAKMIQEIQDSMLRESSVVAREFQVLDLSEAKGRYLECLTERHAISRLLAAKQGHRALMINYSENLAIMLNEEDHARIQTIFPGETIDEAFKYANLVDNLMEENVKYAFDPDFGYLTACPTNTGTGMRASYMLHLPMLEKSGYLQAIMASVMKTGYTIRGTHGEGSSALGSIYQLSNQVTLGVTEEEIISGLKTVAAQIVEKEKSFRERLMREYNVEAEDRFYRAYGIVTHCRKISAGEALALLSEIRLGFLTGKLKEPKPKKFLYNIMMDIQPGTLQQLAGADLDAEKRDVARADYLREVFGAGRP